MSGGALASQYSPFAWFPAEAWVETLMKNLEDLESAVGWSPWGLEIVRFGLNANFIVEHRLTWIDNLETSSGGRLDSPRHPDHHKPYVQSFLRRFGARKVEANALVVRPEAGRKLCQDAINKYVTDEQVEEYDDKVDDQIELVKQALPDALDEWLAQGGLG